MLLMPPIGWNSRSVGSFTITTDADDGILAKSWLATGNFSVGLTSTTWRFQNVTVPQGATILSAVFTVTRLGGETDTCSAVMTGDDVDNSPALSASHNRGNGWTATAASQAMTGTNPANPACDATTIVQEIINRGGWASGNALSLGADNTGSSVDVVNMSATLTVTYTT